jgi:gamma-glutamyl-gamma-aminobutyrate hydrolase PuuD
MPDNDRPEIGIVSYHLRPGRVTNWKVGGYGLPENYVDAVRRAGGRARLVLPGDDRTPAELLDGVDALLLIGGGDVEPSRYGADTGETIYGVEPDRDALEIDLLVEADRRQTPTLCICRGMQVMNVAFRGSLIQDLPSDHRFMPHGAPSGVDAVVHDVKLAGDSAIARATGSDVVACSPHATRAWPGRAGVVATGWARTGSSGNRPGGCWASSGAETPRADGGQQGLFDELIEGGQGLTGRLLPGRWRPVGA